MNRECSKYTCIQVNTNGARTFVDKAFFELRDVAGEFGHLILRYLDKTSCLES